MLEIIDVILGVTASRDGITEAQEKFFTEEMRRAVALHHGACIGGDERCHDIAVMLNKDIYIHPPNDESRMMPREKWLPHHHVFEALPYLKRNKQVVNMSRKLIVLPDGPERLHSGTWSTARYARRLEHPGEICFPNGNIIPISDLKGSYA